MAFKLIDTGWDSIIDEAVHADHTELRLICPFIQRKTAERFLTAGDPGSIHVLTRFNLQDFYCGVNDIAALRLLLSRGARIRGVKNLHSKLYLFGGHRVIVTSANLTEAALKRNYEFGLVADEAGIVQQCRQYFDRLWDGTPPDLTSERLDEWEAKIALIMQTGGRPKIVQGLSDEGVEIGLSAEAIELPPAVPSGAQGFVKFFGVSSDRRPMTSPVLEEVRGSGSHWACTYPKGKRPRQPRDGDMMFPARIAAPDDIMVYGRAIALEHVSGRDDATPYDIGVRPWKETWPHYIRVRNADFVAGTISNGVSLNRLMDELETMAFEPTKRNALAATGNTNPRTAYLQQPGVQLSSEGLAWLNGELEAAFKRHGKLAPADLEQLDWPPLPDTSPAGPP